MLECIKKKEGFRTYGHIHIHDVNNHDLQISIFTDFRNLEDDLICISSDVFEKRQHYVEETKQKIRLNA